MSDYDNLDNLDNNDFLNQEQKTLPNAVAALVLGIISIVLCFLWGIPGIVCGLIAISLRNKDVKMYKKNPEAYKQSYGMLNAGFICGIIGLSLGSLYILFVLVALTAGRF